MFAIFLRRLLYQALIGVLHWYLELNIYPEQGDKVKHMEVIMYLCKEAMFSVVLSMILPIFQPEDCLTMAYNSPQNLSEFIK